MLLRAGVDGLRYALAMHPPKEASMLRVALVLVGAALAVTAVATTVAACGGQSSSGGASGGQDLVQTVKGAELYAESCAGCHGANGGGGSASALAGEGDAAQVEAAIRDGSGSMPAMADVVSEDQITAIAVYVTTQLE
jgi:mono/diheme cytochrome c family protein